MQLDVEHCFGTSLLAMLALVAYLALPFELVPDFIPIVGVLDDAILVGFALRWLLSTRGEAEIRAAWPWPEAPLCLVLAAAGSRGTRVRTSRPKRLQPPA